MQVYHDFFWYPDPDQRFLIRIRIQIRIQIRILANDTDPTGTGSETLHFSQHASILLHFFLSPSFSPGAGVSILE